MKTQRLRVALHSSETFTSWGKAELLITEYLEGRKRRVAVIPIETPCDVRELRRSLDQIVEYWRKELAGL